MMIFTVSACTVVLFLHSTNRGIGRGYLLFGAGVGFILYLATLGQLTKLFFAAVSRCMSLAPYLSEEVIRVMDEDATKGSSLSRSTI